MNFNELINKYEIEIPMLQRDYAQGRDDEKTKQIREKFLTSIFEVLSDEKANLHLEFIYGSMKDGKFIPLDGQQRLTTLFLLHWYFGFDELKDGDKSKFRYETRASSREFCDMLVNLSTKELEEALEAELKDLKTKKEKHEKDLKNKEESLKKLEEKKTLEKEIKELKEKIAELEKEIKEKSKISYYIKNRAEFLPFWEKDPTVKSMLNMLDTIHEKAKISKNIKPENLNNIDFDFLNMGEFGLSDELYIKMNARGKRLTEFEIFKAKFEKLLEESKFDDLLAEFKNKIDGEWANKFWDFNKDEINKTNDDYNPAQSVDDTFMVIFYFISEMLFYKSNENSQKEAKDDEKVEFDKNEALKIYENSQENIEFLFSALDNVDNISTKCEKMFSENSQENRVCIFDEFKENFIKELFENAKAKEKDKKELNNHQKILLFAVIYGVCKNIDDEKLKDILRLVRNISNSAKYHSGGKVEYTKNFRTSAFGWIINEIIYKFEKDNYEINKENRPKEITEDTIEHENAKLKCLNDENYKKAIIEFENHKYLKGDLRNFIYENTGFEDFQKSKEAIEEIFELDDCKITSLLLCFKKEKGTTKEFSIQNFYPYHVGWSGGNPKYHFGKKVDKKDYWEIILTNKDNKVIFENLIKEFLSKKDIEMIINDFKATLTTKNWVYYFLEYSETFFGEITDLNITSEFSNVFKWDTWKGEEIKGYDIEKMSGSTISTEHINPYLYAALQDKKNVEFKDTKENSSSYATIENFIEKLSCKDDGWHIKFDEKFDSSKIVKEFDLEQNSDDEFILKHNPDSDTIEKLQELLENLKTLA